MKVILYNNQEKLLPIISDDVLIAEVEKRKIISNKVEEDRVSFIDPDKARVETLFKLTDLKQGDLSHNVQEKLEAISDYLGKLRNNHD